MEESNLVNFQTHSSIVISRHIYLSVRQPILPLIFVYNPTGKVQLNLNVIVSHTHVRLVIRFLSNLAK